MFSVNLSILNLKEFWRFRTNLSNPLLLLFFLTASSMCVATNAEATWCYYIGCDLFLLVSTGCFRSVPSVFLCNRWRKYRCWRNIWRHNFLLLSVIEPNIIAGLVVSLMELLFVYFIRNLNLWYSLDRNYIWSFSKFRFKNKYYLINDFKVLIVFK